MEYEYTTAGMQDVVMDDGFGQSLYHYNSAPVPSTGYGRAAAMAAMADDMADEQPAAPAPAPPPTAPAAAAKAELGVGKLIGFGVGAGVLTAAGVWGLMKWKECPAAQDAKSAAQVAGVGAASAILAALVVKKLA